MLLWWVIQREVFQNNMFVDMVKLPMWRNLQGYAALTKRAQKLRRLLYDYFNTIDWNVQNVGGT